MVVAKVAVDDTI